MLYLISDWVAFDQGTCTYQGTFDIVLGEPHRDTKQVPRRQLQRFSEWDIKISGQVSGQ